MTTPIKASGDASLIMNTSATGNCSFEVVLSPARAAASPRASKLLQPPSVASPRSLQEIEAKLKTAEGNRERLIDEKLEKIKEHEKRVSEVRKQSVEQAQRTLEQSHKKLAVAEELRQQHFDVLVKKLKEHDNHIEEVRKRLTNKGDTNGEELQRELDDVTADRDLVAEAIQEKQQCNGQNGSTKENLIP